MNSIIYRNHLIAAILILLFLSCNQNNKNEHSFANAIEVNIDNLKSNEIVKFSEIFSNYKVIPLETNKECLIGKISSIRFLKNNIVVLDPLFAKSVYLFEHNGKFIRKIGKLGKGPGEYISPMAISTNEDTKQIAIYDGALNRIQLFNLDGTFLKMVQLKQKIAAKSFEITNDEIFICNYVDKSLNYLLYAIDFNGNIIGEWFPNENISGFSDNAISSPANIFFKRDDELIFRESSLNTIFRIKENFIEPYITLTSEKKLKENELEQINKENFGHASKTMEISNNTFTGILSYVEANNLSIIDFQNNGRTFVSFYDNIKGKLKCTTLSNFRDDLTFFSFRVSGFFLTAYKDNLVASIDGKLSENLLENIKIGKIKLTDHKDHTISPNSNPCIILYTCKEKIVFNEN